MLAAGELANNFDRFMMVGHYHLWYAATAGRPLEWKGDKKLFISNKESIFLVIAPVFSEFCAVLEIQKDSDGEKQPLSLMNSSSYRNEPWNQTHQTLEICVVAEVRAVILLM